MSPGLPGDRPVLIWDGRCGFCRIWVDYFRKRTGDRITYAASQDVAEKFPQIPSQAFGESVQLVRVDGTVAKGARAVFEALGLEGAYEAIPLLAPISEAAYGSIAGHRNLFYQVTRFTFGTDLQPAEFARVQWLFLRMLAMIYAIAFASLAGQVTGLIGARGITPVTEFLAQVKQTYGVSAYYELPSIFWFGSTDVLLRVSAWAGVAIAAVLLAGKLERIALVTLWTLYLSFSTAGQEFFSYQWDALLLEAGFLAIFFGHSRVQQKTIAWLFRLLVFRLYFLSGLVKIASGDANWPALRALDFHFHTQPLPNVVAWYMDKLPEWALRASNLAVLAIELVIPFLIFAPRLWRKAGAWAMLALQALIFATGNYTFFNLLSAALVIFLFADQDLPRGAGFSPREASASPFSLRTAFAITISALGLLRLLDSTTGPLPRPLAQVGRLGAPFMIVNPYGLFAVMTTTRPEIILEGSDDGENWRAYEFRYKPGDLNRAPRQIAPFQPRLDWQMWFAALDDVQASPWFIAFAEQILRGSPDVVALLASNPFSDHPPRYLRAQLFEYSFSTREERARTGAWWHREPRGQFLPPISLREK